MSFEAVGDPLLEMDAEHPRPLRLVPALPDGRVRRGLQRALERRGLHAQSAAAVSRAIVRPEAARALLESPTAYRVPGAELLVVRVEVYTSRVIADPTNPRILNHIPFPAAATRGTSPTAYEPLQSPRMVGQDFAIEADDVEHLIWQLDLAMGATLKANTPRPPIVEQGVMEPPLAVAARMQNRTGMVWGGAVLVREGSTRVSHAQDVLRLSARDMLVRYVDDREQASLIEELNGVALMSARRLSLEDAGRVRVATMPVDLVIGVAQDEGSETSLEAAVAAKVAQDHLNHKKQWDASARDVHLGESCLVALRDESLLSEERYAWLAGRSQLVGAAVDGVAVHEDDRWAELLWFFTTKKRPYSAIVRRPIATVLERERGKKSGTSRADRIPLAVALAMRSRRGRVTEAEVERESGVLASSIGSAALGTTWELDGSTLEELARAAIEGATGRVLTAEGVALAVRASWYLAKHGQLRMPRNDLGAGADRRGPAEILDGALASVRGVRQLVRVIEDGREGRASALVLDDEGSVDVSGVGSPVPLSDEALRLQIVPKAGPTVPPPRDAFEELMDAVADLNRKTQALAAANEVLKAIDDGYGRPIHESRGVSSSQTEDLVAILTAILKDVNRYEFNWQLVRRAEELSERPSPRG